ncbi:type II toxin-antitoxin system RelB/DinJ family antitoxin [Companilactobacillus ginsenosidimutans]|uniref:Damage-inducible protein J n=1 Tax=Companilactobacillus ginsenosidimutans TaxID=1007676 RepID=A0A0H4R1I4_9LACO|nr:type II toxin-antitoxin system RelB/DinJ family antitoxin [Companilactobacillus ginsenosidimutans]AKP67590.1 hypothetical protein ABM34_08635 [Companilactobacillus ginsenosidimutans]
MVTKSFNNNVPIRISIDTNEKRNLVQILKNLNITPSEAVTQLFQQIITTGSYPVDLKLTEKEIASLKSH